MAPAAIERAREAIISRADHTRMSILRLARPFDSRSRHSTLLFEDGLSQFQVSAAAQHFHHAFGLPERALPPAIPAAAGREAGGWHLTRGPGVQRWRFSAAGASARGEIW